MEVDDLTSDEWRAMLVVLSHGLNKLCPDDPTALIGIRGDGRCVVRGNKLINRLVSIDELAGLLEEGAK